MRFFLAFVAIAWYVSCVQATEVVVPKSLFKMNGAGGTTAITLPAKTPAPSNNYVEQPRFEYRQVQVCYGNYCRMEWRLMPVNQPSATPSSR